MARFFRKTDRKIDRQHDRNVAIGCGVLIIGTILAWLLIAAIVWKYWPE